MLTLQSCPDTLFREFLTAAISFESMFSLKICYAWRLYPKQLWMALLYINVACSIQFCGGEDPAGTLIRGVRIHIFMFCLINFFSNWITLNLIREEIFDGRNMNVWISPQAPINVLATALCWWWNRMKNNNGHSISDPVKWRIFLIETVLYDEKPKIP